jgi:carboxyl-terminal processing protease
VGAVITLAVGLIIVKDRRGGLDLAPEIRFVEDRASMDEIPYEGTDLRTTYRTINLVQKHYLDPSRVKPREMLVAAMQGMQRKIAQVLVREEGDELVLMLGASAKRFDLGDVKSPWVMLQQIREMFAFVKEGVSDNDIDFQEVEYAVISSMLETLDPHSALLPPDMYRDMKDKTQGEFGGLGVVISLRDGALTVISPIKGTPASKAGLKSGDKIVKIGETSTVSMSLNDAVNLMRGKPGTSVVLWILRKQWEEPRSVEIVRAIIQVQSVESEILSGRIGYVRISDFQGNTAVDLRQQMGELAEKGARGLVLDMRNNPGGLLKAAIEVSDIFLRAGVIVTTAGQSPTDRDIRRAKDTGDEVTYPVVVLVNSGSASASEIVAGALKNQGRALVAGERTFGKGSVQVLYDYNDGSALKLTTAQYLTPGDISIQSVGVVPHVEILPMRADKEMLDLKVEAGYRESDLDHHLEEEITASMRVGRPSATVRYLWEPPAAKKKTGKGKNDKPDGGGVVDGDEDMPFEPDFEINLARDLVVEMISRKSSAVDVGALDRVLTARNEREQGRLEASLRKLGIDWSVGREGGNVDLAASVRISGEDDLVAGSSARLEVTLTNNGPGTLYRLLATTRSDFRALADRELAFGRLGPSESVSKILEFKVPKDIESQTDDVLITFEDVSQHALPSTALRFRLQELPAPRFAYSIQMVDFESGNGDGFLQAGEKVKLLVDIDNVGEGKAMSTYATLKSLSGKEVFLLKGRGKPGEMSRGEQKQVVFEFEVKPTFKRNVARFELAVMDLDLKVYSMEKISFEIKPPIQVLEIEPRTLVAKEDSVEVREAPAGDARVVAVLEGKGAVEISAKAGDFYRIEIAEGRPGWVSARSFADPKGETPEACRFTLVINAPPALVLDEIESVVRRSTIRLTGRASDESRVRDIYIYVGDSKVFFKPNTDPDNPRELSFVAEVEIKKGLNYITIVAEETPALDTRKVITVRRDRVDGMPFVKAWNRTKPEPIGILPTVR